MKIRYYLKGLGTGILIATCILYFAYKNDISDADIILKAKRLGMVFAEDVSGSSLGIDELKETEIPSKTLIPSITKKPIVTQIPFEAPKEPGDEPLKNLETTQMPETTETPESLNVPETTEAPEITSNPDVTNTPETPEITKEPQEDNNLDEFVSFTINRGDWSRVVSERLESLGIVDDAKKFDKYLVDKGYAVRIKVGTFKINKGASYDDIAKMITK